jgi:folate-binding protein YgfZ
MTKMEIPPLFYVDRSDRGRLRLTGRDRQTFLQGMVTNDVVRLQPGQGCYAFMLDATGHVLADMRILCTEDSLLLDLEPGMASSVAETLDKYLIMEKCRITDVSAETRQIFLGGAGITGTTADFLPTLPRQPGEWQEGDNSHDSFFGPQFLRFAATRLIAGAGFDLYFPSTVTKVTTTKETMAFDVNLAEELDKSGFVSLAPETLDALRIEAGIPRFGVDMDSRVLAPETGQESRAISYKKGCYIGQEIVARIDARGRVNRRLTGFRLDPTLMPDALPAADTPIMVNGKEVGRVTSAAIGPTLGVPLALGYLRREHSEPGTAVTIADAPATVAALPFAPTPEESGSAS